MCRPPEARGKRGGEGGGRGGKFRARNYRFKRVNVLLTNLLIFAGFSARISRTNTGKIPVEAC